MAEELIHGMEESNVVNVCAIPFLSVSLFYAANARTPSSNQSSVTNQPSVFRQMNIDNSLLSETQQSTIEAILYDTSGAWVKNGPHERYLAIASLTSDPWWQIDSIIQRIKALVEYMKPEREDLTVPGLINAMKRELSEPAWPQDRQKHVRSFRPPHCSTG